MKYFSAMELRPLASSLQKKKKKKEKEKEKERKKERKEKNPQKNKKQNYITLACFVAKLINIYPDFWPRWRCR